MTIKIEECDRIAAAEWTKTRCRGLGMSDNQVGAISEAIVNGNADDDDLVQAFAKHRISAMEKAAEIAVAELMLSADSEDLTGFHGSNLRCRTIAKNIRDAINGE